RVLELAVLLGELARRLTHAGLEPAGQILDPDEHAVEAPPEEAELPAARVGDARVEPARLGPAHRVHERQDGPGHATLEEHRQAERDEDDRGEEERTVDDTEPLL